jgi:hypothetical protein
VLLAVSWIALHLNFLCLLAGVLFQTSFLGCANHLPRSTRWATLILRPSPLVTPGLCSRLPSLRLYLPRQWPSPNADRAMGYLALSAGTETVQPFAPFWEFAVYSGCTVKPVLVLAVSEMPTGESHGPWKPCHSGSGCLAFGRYKDRPGRRIEQFSIFFHLNQDRS